LDIFDPFRREFNRLRREIDRAFESFWTREGTVEVPTVAYPCDIREAEDRVVVEAELPGFKRDEIDVRIEGNMLIIDAQRKEEKERKGEPRLTERRFAHVHRSFLLPASVKEDQIEAHLENGVLTLIMPKREEAKPKRIPVK
jgi:HSP20 family protein